MTLIFGSPDSEGPKAAEPTCKICGGKGHDKDGECYRCEGTGIDPGDEEGEHRRLRLGWPVVGTENPKPRDKEADEVETAEPQNAPLGPT